VRVLAEDDQFCEYSKTSLRICGTKAVWPFEGFDPSCALNIGFVRGAINLEEEDIGVGVRCREAEGNSRESWEF
jgi:hypothetical protein